jgi:hypothetical protein
MNIILTCLINFQDYILINIDQLLKLQHKKIHVITNRHLSHHFEKYGSVIKIFFVEDLQDSFHFNEKTSLDNSFRNGFWNITSYRFFVIYECMKVHNIKNVIHLENDVLIYYHCDILKDKLSDQFLYIPFDSFQRNIASIVYIPNHHIFEKILKEYDVNKNDMYNFRQIQLKTGFIEQFPIFKSNDKDNDEHKFVTKNYEIFHMIFDAAAIGQYLGGVDPRNTPGDTRGFINETCIIKYNQYHLFWKEYPIIFNHQTVSTTIKRPFLLYENEEIPIFNLHIHCKNLQAFV